VVVAGCPPPTGWRTITSEEGGFSIDFPGAPDFAGPTSDELYVWHARSTSTIPNGRLEFMAAVLSPPDAGAPQKGEVRRRAETFCREFRLSENLVRAEYVAGHPGWECEGRPSPGAFAGARVVVVGGKVILFGGGVWGDVPIQDVRRFITSFKVTTTVSE
jgi:hypothetical protein